MSRLSGEVSEIRAFNSDFRYPERRPELRQQGVRPFNRLITPVANRLRSGAIRCVLKREGSPTQTETHLGSSGVCQPSVRVQLQGLPTRIAFCGRTECRH